MDAGVPAPLPAESNTRRRGRPRKQQAPECEVIKETTAKGSVPKQKRRRGTKTTSPEDNYHHEEDNRVTLADFLKNSSMSSGRPMKAAVEREEGRKKKKDNENGIPTPSFMTPVPQMQAQNLFCTPQVKLIDGQIVIDEQSVLLDGPSDTNVDSITIVNETSSHITSASYSNRAASEKWTAAETDEFYEAIRRYGTDFTLLEKLFAKRTRKQLKSKFKREEKENPRRIDDALKNTIPIDIEHYHAAITQAAEKKKIIEENKEQGNSHPPLTDDNIQERTVPGSSTQPQKNTLDSNSKPQIHVDEIEVDEATLASLQDAQYDYINGSYDDDYDED